jgi:hypothetical protein
MKLNLLPTYVSKGKATKTAAVISVLLVFASVACSVMMSVAVNQRLQVDKQVMEDMRLKADNTVKTYDHAKELVDDPKVAQLIRNTGLANAMISHNDVYPNFYNRFLRYIPSFFRLTSIQATPNDKDSSTVTMTGVLKTYQQYADLMLALLRYPNAVSVGRQGFQSRDKVVQPLSASNPTGTALRPGEAPVPQDPLQQLQYFQGQNFAPRGYTGVGNFGAEGIGTRSAMTDYSLITVTMTVKDNLQVPDIAGTLSQSGGGAASAQTVSAPGGPPFGGPGGMPGMPGGGGPPMGGPPAGAVGGRD